MVAVARNEGQGALRRMLAGAAFVLRGIAYFARHRWTWPLGAVPILFAVVLTAGLIVAGWVGSVVTFYWLVEVGTRLFGTYQTALEEALLWLALVAIDSLIALVLVLFFADVVKIIGQPFWKEMTARMERELGGEPLAAPGAGNAWVALRDSAVLLAIWFAVAAPLLLLGLVPVLGQTAVPVGEALLAGWVVAAELTQIPLDRRGLGARERQRFLRAHRAETLGFGLASLALFLVPLANVLLLPGAILGGTMLVRQLEKPE